MATPSICPAHSHIVNHLEHLFVFDIVQPKSLQLISLTFEKRLALLEVLLQHVHLRLGVYGRPHPLINHTHTCATPTFYSTVNLAECS